MISRGVFIRQIAFLTAGAVAPAYIRKFSGKPDRASDITILYTNDTHARLDPFPGNAREFAGLGGIARRASLVKKIRTEEEHVLLLDAGDVFQGTPWFEVYGGKVDFELMSEMGYDAMAVGNHEFDRGPEGLAEAARQANFPLLASNYYTRNTPLHPYMERHLIREAEGFRIGIFGLGIELAGLVDKSLRGNVRSHEPLTGARRSVESLREFYSCDYVICLSHLGFRYPDNSRIDDLTLAESVEGIDLIIGGHTHTFLDEPVIVDHTAGNRTIVTQMGHSGVRVGRIDLSLPDIDGAIGFQSRYYTIDGK